VNFASVLRSVVRRSLFSCLALTMSLACVVPPAASAAPADDQQALERGRVMGRVLVWFRAPSMCAIATLRASCKADFETFVGKRTDDSFSHIQNIGPTPLSRMRHYIAGGDPDDFEPEFIKIYGITASVGERAASPRAAWLYDAGIVDETFPGAVQVLSMQLLSRGTLLDMILHIRDAGPYSTLFPAGSLEKLGDASATTPLPPEMVSDIAVHLPENIDKAFPAQPVPRLPDPIDPVRADVAFGLALGTQQELVDLPVALALPESQRFLDDWAVRAKRYAKTDADNTLIDAMRDGLRVRYPVDAAALTAAGTEHLADINTMLGNEHSRRAAVALNAMQIAYNASYVRSAPNATIYCTVLGKLSDADAAFPELTRRRAQLAAAKPADFPTQYRLATSLVDYLLAGMAR